MPFNLYCNASDTTPRLFKREIRGSFQPSEEDKEKLQSTAFIKAMDLLCEGPIEGIVDATGKLAKGSDIFKGIYLNEVPVQLTKKGAPLYNFRNVSIAYKKGTETQTPFYTEQNDDFYWLKDFSYTSKTVPVGVSLDNQTILEATSQAKKLNAQASYSIVDQDVDYVGLTIGISECYTIDEDGQHQMNEGGFQIYGDITGVVHRSLGEEEVARIVDDGVDEQNVVVHVKGLSLNAYKEDIFFKLKDAKDIGSSRPRHIHIKNTTTQSLNFRNKFSASLDAVTEIVDVNLSNPNSAVVAAVVSAENFSGPPTRSYDVKLKKVKVPKNYVDKLEGPDGPTKIRAYSSEYGAAGSESTSENRHEGIWDGTFKEELEWTDNPAWILYDLITNDRYGLGEYIREEDVDKWELYKIAKYCDDLVPTSRPASGGGFVQERRFTCNILLTNASDAYQTLNEICSIFRGIAYFNNLEIFVAMNSLKTPMATFTNDNVVDGIFRYGGSPEHTKFTAVKVAYKDKTDSFLPKYAYIEDAEGIIRYGLRLKSLAAAGCTSRDQALRLGRWTLLTANLEEETVSFATDRQAEYIQPGQVFTIYDELRQSFRIGGRVKAIQRSTSSVEGNFLLLDQQIDTDKYDMTSISFLIPSKDYQGDGNTHQFKEFIHRNGYNIGAQDNGDRDFEVIPLHSESSNNTSLHNYIENTPSGAKILTDENQDLILKKPISGSHISNEARHKTFNDYLLSSDVLKDLRNGEDRAQVTDKIREGTLYLIHGVSKDGNISDFKGKDYQLISKQENSDGTFAISALEYDSGKFDKTDALSTIYTETTYNYDPSEGGDSGGPGEDEEPPEQPPVPPPTEPPVVNLGYPKTNTVDLIVESSGVINSQGETKSRVSYYFHNTQENEPYYRNNLSAGYYGFRVSMISDKYYGRLLTARDNGEKVLQHGQYIVSGKQDCGDYRVLYDNTQTASEYYLTPSGKAVLGGQDNNSVAISTFKSSEFNPFLTVERPRAIYEFADLKAEGCTVFEKKYEDKILTDVLSGEFDLPDPEAYYELRWFEGNSFGRSPEKVMIFKGAKDVTPPAVPTNFNVSINQLFPNQLNFEWDHQEGKDSDLIGFRIYTGHEGSEDPNIKFSKYSDDINPKNSFHTPKQGSSFAEVVGKNARYFTYEADTSDGTLRNNKGEPIGFGDKAAFHIRAFDYSENLSDGANSNILSLTNISAAPDIHLSGEIVEEAIGTDSYRWSPILHVFYSGSYHTFKSFKNYHLKINDETYGFGSPNSYVIPLQDVKPAPERFGVQGSGYYEIRSVLPGATYYGEIYAVMNDGRESREGNHTATIPKDTFPPAKLNDFRVSKQFSNFRFSWAEPEERDVAKILLYTGSGHSNWGVPLNKESETSNLTNPEFKPQTEHFLVSDPTDFPAAPIDKFREIGSESWQKTKFPFHAVPVDTSNNTGMYSNYTYRYVNLAGPEVHTSGEAHPDGRSLIHVFYSGIGQNDESFKYYETEYQDVTSSDSFLINSYSDSKKSNLDHSLIGKGSGHFSFEALGTHLYEVRTRVIFDSFESNFSDDVRLSNHEYGITSDFIYAPPDRIPPGRPEWIAAQKNGPNVFLSWDNPPDRDLKSILLYTGYQNFTGEKDGTYLHQNTLTNVDLIALRNFRKNSENDLYFWLRAVDTSNNTGEWSIGNTAIGNPDQKDPFGKPYNSGQRIGIGLPEPLHREHIIATTGIEIDEKGDGTSKPFISYMITGNLDYQRAYYKVDLSRKNDYSILKGTQNIDIEHGPRTNTMTGSGIFTDLIANEEYYLRARFQEFDGRVSAYTDCIQNPIKTPKDTTPPKNPTNFVIVSGPKQNIINWKWEGGVSKDLASLLVYKTGIPTGRINKKSSEDNCWSSAHISGYFEKNIDEYAFQLAPSTSFIDNDVVTGLNYNWGLPGNLNGKYERPLNNVYYHYFIKTIDRSGNTGIGFVSGISQDTHTSYPINPSKTAHSSFANDSYAQTPHNQGYVTGGAISASYISNVYAGNIISSKVTSTDFILAHPSGRILSDSVHTLGPSYGPNPGPNVHEYDYLAGPGLYMDHKMFRIGDPEGNGIFWTGEKVNGKFKQPTFEHRPDGWHNIDINPNTLEIKGNLTAGTVQIGANEQAALDIDQYGNLSIGDQRKNIRGFFTGVLGYSGIMHDELGNQEPASVLPANINDAGKAYVQLNLDDYENYELSDLAGGGMFIEMHWTRDGGKYHGIETRQVLDINLRPDRDYEQGFGKVRLGGAAGSFDGVSLTTRYGNTYGLKGVTTTGALIYWDKPEHKNHPLYQQPRDRDWFLIHNAKFKVLNDGSVFADSAQIGGVVTADSFQAGNNITLGDEENQYNTLISSYGFVDDLPCKDTSQDGRGWGIRGDGHAVFKSIDIRSGIISGVSFAAGDCDSRNHFRVNTRGDISLGPSNYYAKNNFYVTRNGELHATDAFFSGDVTITGTLDVGEGLQIATDIRGHKDGDPATFHAEGAKGILITKDDIRSTNYSDANFTLPSMVGHGRPQNRGWKITNDGNAVFFGAYVTGGFLSGNSIIAGEGTPDRPYFKISSDGEMQVGAFGPGVTAASAPKSGQGLFISRKGALYAQDAYIRGNITGDAGKIGSLYLARNYLATYDHSTEGRNTRTSHKWQAGKTGLYLGKNGDFSISNNEGLIFAYDPDHNSSYVTITGIASSSNRQSELANLTNQNSQRPWKGDGKGKGFVFAGDGDSWLANFSTDPYSASGIAGLVETQINGDIQNPEQNKKYTVMAKSPIGYDVLGIYMETDAGTATVQWSKNATNVGQRSILGLEKDGAGYINMSVDTNGSYHDFIGKRYKHGTDNYVSIVGSAATTINPDSADCYIVCMPTVVAGATSLRFRIDLKRNGNLDAKN